MLVHKIREGQGKMTGTSVLPSTDDLKYVKLEVSFQERGTVLAIPSTNMGTYETYERIPGQLYGRGQVIVMIDEGDGIIWNGEGVGRPTGEGMALSFRRAVTFQRNPEKLARLNSVVGVYGFEQDNEVNGQFSGWE